jgi:ATP-dependent protease ClpP protease subunit
MLRDKDNSKIDMYLETPGGSGEAAEEIVNFLSIIPPQIQTTG